MPTPICLQCGKETQPREERKKYLMGKVQDYKDNKTRRAERKTKWELWKKTQVNNYNTIIFFIYLTIQK